jgi:hypothetical protein
LPAPGASALVAEAPLDRALARLRLPSRHRSDGDLREHALQAIETIRAIALSVSMPIRGDHDLTRRRDSRPESLQEAAPRPGRGSDSTPRSSAAAPCSPPCSRSVHPAPSFARNVISRSGTRMDTNGHPDRQPTKPSAGSSRKGGSRSPATVQCTATAEDQPKPGSLGYGRGSGSAVERISLETSRSSGLACCRIFRSRGVMGGSK